VQPPPLGDAGLGYSNVPRHPGVRYCQFDHPRSLAACGVFNPGHNVPPASLDFARMKPSGLPHEAFMVIFLNAKNWVLDHLIVGKEGYCSFVESRLMPGS
jgi:hypothetical protein